MNEDVQYVDYYKASDLAAIATQQPGRYHPSHRHQFTPDVMVQDASCAISQNDIEMYGVFCGYNNGGNVANFVMNRMSYEVFTEQPITRNMDPDQIADQLREKFLNVSLRYKNELNEILSEIFIMELPDTPTDRDKINELKNKVKAGCTALVVLRIDDDLYVLNCGTSVPLVLNETHAMRLTDQVHDNENPEEIQRLLSIGVNPNDVTTPTRAIGDGYRSMDLYEQEPEFKQAKSPPVISEPEVFQVKIQHDWRHLLLVSGGMIQNVKDCEVDDVQTELNDLFQVQTTREGTASNLVFKVGMKHKDAYDRRVKESPETHFSNHREEMTLIYVKLQDAISIISTIDSSVNSTVGIVEPETYLPYVDLSPDRAVQVAKELEKYLAMPTNSSPTMSS